jgi:hypothetical protein
MMLLMVKEADLNRIEVPEDCEVLDATALGRRLGFKRDTVLAYLSRRNFGLLYGMEADPLRSCHLRNYAIEMSLEEAYLYS